MTKLSERIQNIINTLVERVSSMEESAEDCVAYSKLIEDLFTLFNTVERMEKTAPDNYAFFQRNTTLITNAERELNIAPTTLSE